MSETIIDVTNGKKILYNKLLEGQYIEGCTEYYPRSGLWECKNGEVINVVESIKQGKRVLAEPKHYHNNSGMCAESGTIKDVATGEVVDLIDSILSSGGGSGQNIIFADTKPSQVGCFWVDTSKEISTLEEI